MPATLNWITASKAARHVQVASNIAVRAQWQLGPPSSYCCCQVPFVQRNSPCWAACTAVKVSLRSNGDVPVLSFDRVTALLADIRCVQTGSAAAGQKKQRLSRQRGASQGQGCPGQESHSDAKKGTAEVHTCPPDRMRAIRQKVEHWMERDATEEPGTAHAVPHHHDGGDNALASASCPAATVHPTSHTDQCPGMSQAASTGGACAPVTCKTRPQQQARQPVASQALAEHVRPAPRKQQGSAHVGHLPISTPAAALPSKEGIPRKGRLMQPRQPRGVPQAETMRSYTDLANPVLHMVKADKHRRLPATLQLRPQTDAAATIMDGSPQMWQRPGAGRTVAAFWCVLGHTEPHTRLRGRHLVSTFITFYGVSTLVFTLQGG